LQYGFRYLIALLVPSALVMALLGEQIIAVAFQRGEFLLENTIMAARVLRGFCIGLLSVGAYNFYQRFFYSVGDYRTPMVVAGITFVIDVVLSLWLKETVLAVAGLSTANSVAFTIGLIIMMVQARRHVGGFEFRGIAATLGKTIVASAALVVVSRAFELWSGASWWQGGSTALGFAYLIGVCGVMVGVVLGLYIVLKVDVVSVLLRRKKP
jgi:putative peptidoglycan lipid II flippase